MKILIVSPCELPVPAVFGGAVETLIESIVKENEREKKMQISVFGIDSAEAEREAEKYENTNFIWCRVSEWVKRIDLQITDRIAKNKNYARKIYVIGQLRKRLSEDNYDAIVIQNAGYLLKAFKKKRLLEKYRGKIYYHLHNDIPHNADRKVLENVKFILVSGYLVGGVLNLCGEEVINRCRVVKNGIDIHRFNQKLDASEKYKILDDLGIERGKRIIVFVGRIRKEKGVMELLKAVQMLERNDMALVVIGSADFGVKEESDFERTIKRLCRELPGKVFFTGFIHNSEVWKYYRAADIAVLPSTGQEPAGLTMLEACAAGLPVITTNAGGIPEYMDKRFCTMLDLDDSFEYRLKNAIYDNLENLNSWKEKREASERYIEHNFSEKIFFDHFLNAVAEQGGQNE